MSLETQRPLTSQPPQSVIAASAEADAQVPTSRRRRRAKPETETGPGLVSIADWRRKSLRRRIGLVHGLLLALLLLWGLVPMLWLAKASITPTQDTLQNPMQLWPDDIAWENLSNAWNQVQLGRAFFNTVVVAVGSWASQLIVATTAGYGLAVLRPKYARILNPLVVATLFIPAVVLLVPLYLTVLDVPFVHWRLIDTYWAIWLPAGANAFNVVLVKRFFDNLPKEIFEAARVDGAGPFRLFWSIVLPMSKPILGVVSVFAFISAWKDYLWPLLVITRPEKQPLSVRLPTLANSIDLGTFLAALFISTLLPVILFVIFQRVFLRGSGLGGAIKG